MSNALFPAQIRGLAYTVVKTQENSVIVKNSKSLLSNRFVQNLNPKWHWRLEYSVLFDSSVYSSRLSTYTDLQNMIGFCQARNGNFDSFLYSDPNDNFVGPGVITATWQANYPYMLGTIIIASGHAQQVSSAPAGAKSGYTIPTFSTSGGTASDGGLTWQDLGLGTSGGTNWPNPQATLQVVTDGTNYYSPIQRNLGGQFWEDITDLNGGIALYCNGSPAPTSYSLQFGGLNLLNFTSNGLFVNWGTSPPTQPVTATFNYFFRVRFEDTTTDFEKFANQLWSMGGEQGVQGKGYLRFESSIPAQGVNYSPAPPIAFPAGATNFLILYPKNVTYVNGGSAIGGISQPWDQSIGYGVGAAGQGAWFLARSNNIVVGEFGGIVTFNNYPTPLIPRGAIKAVYSYIPFTLKAGPTGNVDQAQMGLSANGTNLIGGPNTVTPGSYTGSTGGLGSTIVSVIQGSVTIANLNFSTIIQKCFVQPPLNYTFYGDSYTGNPMVIVYY